MTPRNSSPEISCRNSRRRVDKKWAWNELRNWMLGKKVEKSCTTKGQEMHSPSGLMPIDMHFLSLQYWHWLRWCWSTGQFCFPRHWYVRFRLTDLLKKLLQPGNRAHHPISIRSLDLLFDFASVKKSRHVPRVICVKKEDNSTPPTKSCLIDQSAPLYLVLVVPFLMPSIC